MMLKKILNRVNLKNAYIRNSSIGNYYNVDVLRLAIEDGFRLLEADIAEFEDTNMRTSLIQELYAIKQYYSSDEARFIRQIGVLSCSTMREPTLFQIGSILKYWTILKYYDSSVDLMQLDHNDLGIDLNGVRNWLFTPGVNSFISIEKSISKLIYYINITKNDAVKKGRCFISNLSMDSQFGCHNCQNGCINEFIVERIKTDFVDNSDGDTGTNENTMFEDYMSIKNKKELSFNCGNCITDVEKLTDNLNKLSV